MRVKQTAFLSAHLGVLALVLGSVCFAQEAQKPRSESSSDPGVAEIRQQLGQTQAQLEQSQKQIEELRAIVVRLQDQVTVLASAKAPNGAAPLSANAALERTPQAASQAAITEEDWELINAKVEEHQQIKVESGSKFKLKLSGMVLMNGFINNGVVDNIDLPSLAQRDRLANAPGSIGATLRQSLVAVTGMGPPILGAKTSGDLQMDFFGGTSQGYAGVSAGVARLRLARLRMDWDKTSVVGGIDTPFFSPNSPTTYVTVAEPGFATSGNLWSWVPSFKLEHRFDAGPAVLKAEGGVLDPVAYYRVRLDERYPSPGESSRQPAYSARISANNRNSDRPMSFGVAGVYTPQWFPLNRSTDGWAGSIDWRTPLFPKAELSGEAFVGKGVEGFGGLTLGVLLPVDFHFQYVTGPLLARIKMLGGWSQFKYRFDTRNEVNVAGGYGGLQSGSLRQFASMDSYLAFVPARNESFFANYIFRPRSDLLFSVEYRKLRTFGVNGVSESADHVGLAAGFLF